MREKTVVNSATARRSVESMQRGWPQLLHFRRPAKPAGSPAAFSVIGSGVGCHRKVRGVGSGRGAEDNICGLRTDDTIRCFSNGVL